MGLDPAYSLVEDSNSRMDYSSHLERVRRLDNNNYLATHFRHIKCMCTHTHTHTLSLVQCISPLFQVTNSVIFFIDSLSRIKRRISTEV